MMAARPFAISLVLAALFVIGFTLMGFEMLGSRYLNPYFGGGITTWASLISVVLLAMMLGYFGGGYVVDSYPGLEVLVMNVAVAGVSLLLVPVTADALIEGILNAFGDGFWGVVTAAFCLSFIPVALLSACSPYVVRLLLIDLNAGGKTTGLVYAVSTFGNVAGTLVTTFYLIPGFGTRAITSAFGIGLIILAGLIFIFKGRISKALVAPSWLLAILPISLIAACMTMAQPNSAHAEATPIKPLHTFEAAYPEGPLWQGDKLFYAEMPRHRVMLWDGSEPKEFWSEEGCGPTAIAPFKTGDFIILCHLAAKIVHVGGDGATITDYSHATDGTRFRDPNDCHTDGNGGVFFSDPGPFQTPHPANGAVYHIGADEKIVQVLRGLKYANGVAYDVKAKRLFVSEHLGQRVWAYGLGDAQAVMSKTALLNFNNVLPKSQMKNPLTGPDGVELLGQGKALLAVYGAGCVVMFKTQGKADEVKRLYVDMPFVTNVAVSKTHVAIVGAFVSNAPPFPGQVQIYSRQQLVDAPDGQILSAKQTQPTHD